MPYSLVSSCHNPEFLHGRGDCSDGREALSKALPSDGRAAACWMWMCGWWHDTKQDVLGQRGRALSVFLLERRANRVADHTREGA